MSLAEVRRLLDGAAEPPRDSPGELAPLPPDDPTVGETLDALCAAPGLAALRSDPYWPKWDAPWWRFALLDELRLGHLVSRPAARALADAVGNHYLKVFPVRAEELPPGVDPVRRILCHCALGTLWRVLDGASLDVDGVLPWLRPWVSRYQLPDGGWNCDEAAYVKPEPRSSLVSTLPPLEALLGARRPPPTPAERAVLARGAAYLLGHRLCRGRRPPGALLSPAWLEPAFPRFYEYDVLRGLTHLALWAEAARAPLQAPALLEALAAVAGRVDGRGLVLPRRPALESARNYAPGPDGAWSWRDEARTFPLLDRALDGEVGARALTLEWRETAARLRGLDRAGLLTDEEG